MRPSIVCFFVLALAAGAAQSADQPLPEELPVVMPVVTPEELPVDAPRSLSPELPSCSQSDVAGIPQPGESVGCHTHPASVGVLSESGLFVTVGDLVFPICASAESDVDGDGYGWENEQSCVVYASAPESPVQLEAGPGDTAQTIEPSSATTASLHVFKAPKFREKVNVCEVHSLATLRSCVLGSSAYNGLDITADLSCSGQDCCAQNNALVSLSGNRDFTIHGNNHLMRRESGHRQCSLIEVTNAANVVVENWHLDDDARVPGCVVADNCPRMVHIRNSENITLDGVHISNGKGYNVYVDGVDAFTFQNSSIINAGILGLYVGHGDNYSSSVSVTDSLFTDIQTNAVALLGVGGSVANVISDNTFLRNHRYGHWAVAPQYGVGMTGGGQVYIARAENVLIEGNTILDGYCENCFISNTNRTGIHGIELGEPHRVSISNVSVTDNLIGNNDGSAIYLNQGNVIDSSIRISGNTLLNNTDGVPQALHVNGAAIGDNNSRSTADFESFERGLAANGFTVSRHCASNSTVSRVCDGRALHGSCAVNLSVGAGNCDAPAVSLESPWFTIASGRSLTATGWLIRNNPGNDVRHGEWCLEFADNDGQTIESVCDAIAGSDDTEQGYTGLPLLSAKPPAGSSRARWVLVNLSETVPLSLDDVKLSGVQ